MINITASEIFSKQLNSLVLFGISLLVITAVLLFGTAPQADAFEEVAVNIEVNDTDGDAGMQIFIDGGPWKHARVKAPNGRTVYAVAMVGKLRRFGGVESFLETNEPNYEEDMSLPEILEFLPAGEYKFIGRSIENERLSGSELLTHDLPCGPVVTSPVSEDPEENPVLDPTEPAVISWEAVENKIDTTTDEGECGEGEVTIVGYEVIVENETVEPTESFKIDVPAEVLKVTLPPEFVIPDSEYKFEILAIEESGNQTITERAFETSD